MNPKVLIAETPAGPMTFAEEKGNFLRQRIHNLEAFATAHIRMELLASNGIYHARIVEVRAYR